MLYFLAVFILVSLVWAVIFFNTKNSIVEIVKRRSLDDQGTSSNPIANNSKFSANVKFDNLSDLIFFENLFEILENGLDEKQSKERFKTYKNKLKKEKETLLEEISKSL